MKNVVTIWVNLLMVVGFSTTLFAQEPTDKVDLDSRVQELGIELVPVGKPGAIYKRVVVVGNMAYTSGHIAIAASGEIMTGKLGKGIDVEGGQKAAERCAVAMLSSLKAELGSLNRIKRLVKTTGMVNSSPEFTGQSQVVNGFSKVFQELMGEENGVGARSAVGMSSLPLGTIVEVEAIFELNDE